MVGIMRYDSDGSAYEVWAQEQANSCAVASIWMARNQALQQTMMQGEWALAWQMYGQIVQGLDLVPAPPAGMTLDPRAFKSDQNSFEDMFASFGTFMDQVASKLIKDGLKITLKTPFAAGAVVDTTKLSDTTPAIVLLGWYNGTKRNGGHFIVASHVTKAKKVVFLDPWEGKLNELGAGPAYPGGGKFEQIVYISA